MPDKRVNLVALTCLCRIAAPHHVRGATRGASPRAPAHRRALWQVERSPRDLGDDRVGLHRIYDFAATLGRSPDLIRHDTIVAPNRQVPSRASVRTLALSQQAVPSASCATTFFTRA